MNVYIHIHFITKAKHAFSFCISVMISEIFVYNAIKKKKAFGDKETIVKTTHNNILSVPKYCIVSFNETFPLMRCFF